MYSYDDVKKIKSNLEWIVHQATARRHLPTTHDQIAIQHLRELIHIYEGLLESISKLGASVIDTNIAEGLALTEKFITKIKRGMGAR